MKHDPVDRPKHYNQGGVECLDAIEAALTPEEFKGYCKGNIITVSYTHLPLPTILLV